MPPQKGYKLSDKSRKKMSESMKKHYRSGLLKQNQGPKNPRWRGGTLQYKKKLALIRDNYTCQVCGFRDMEIMEVDHIIPVLRNSRERNKMIGDMDNLQTLCPNCHRRKTNRERKNKIY